MILVIWLFPCLPACSVLCFVLMSGVEGIWCSELVTEATEEFRRQSGRGGNRRLAAIAHPRAGGLKGGRGVTRAQGPGFPRDIENHDQPVLQKLGSGKRQATQTVLSKAGVPHLLSSPTCHTSPPSFSR